MKKLLLLSALLIFACSSDDSTSDDNSQPSNCDVVYLDDNGITIKACDDAIVGQSGVVNGISYTIVSGAMLDDLIANGDDLTRVCTTRIVDMQNLFEYSTSNQPIGNWDVSNVTNMNFMFFRAGSFNQDISNWDVSNVTDMSQVFRQADEFNQDIGSWDVSNVTDMAVMFAYAISFNQDIGSWDVSNVLNCDDFNYLTPQWTLPKPNLPSDCLD
jgi:surface protein